ncbi:MAG: sulfatase [Halobacteriaceae archaeon]
MTDADRPNVLLVVLDSVRAANTSLHGHEHATTPFLEEFADRATVFEQARSPGTWSLPSHAAIFTGYHVAEHGVTRARHRLEPGHTVFEELRDEHGYATGVFSENTWITDMDVGLKEAFDTVEGARNLLFPDAIDPSNFVLTEGQGKYLEFLRYCLGRDDTLRSLANGAYTKLAWDYPGLLPDRFSSSTPADVYTDLLLDWADERDGPWAACVNYMDGHLPYLPADEHDLWGGDRLRDLQAEMDDQVWEFVGGQRPWWQRRALEGLYDGTIHQMDAELRRLVGALAERGTLEDTLLVVTSDHGEGFGELSRVRCTRDSDRPNVRSSGHGDGLHEVLLHVPLVVKAPGQTGGERVDGVASLTQFPDAVRAAIGESSAPTDAAPPDAASAFVPAEPVVASSHGQEEPMEERAREYTGDTYAFNGTARAVFEGAGQDVVKYLTWRDRAATVRTPEAKCGYRTAADDGGRVDERFADIADRGVRTDEDGEIDEATQRRLADLGYR